METVVCLLKIFLRLFGIFLSADTITQHFRGFAASVSVILIGGQLIIFKCFLVILRNTVPVKIQAAERVLGEFISRRRGFFKPCECPGVVLFRAVAERIHFPDPILHIIFQPLCGRFKREETLQCLFKIFIGFRNIFFAKQAVPIHFPDIKKGEDISLFGFSSEQLKCFRNIAAFIQLVASGFIFRRPLDI